VKPFRWSDEKNASLLARRGLSFERIIIAIEAGGLIDELSHPNEARYPDQRILVVDIDGYAVLVPYVEGDDHLFLKTIIPSRTATRDYLRRPAT
jgi:uncharacterized DUF497 family protein